MHHAIEHCAGVCYGTDRRIRSLHVHALFRSVHLAPCLPQRGAGLEPRQHEVVVIIHSPHFGRALFVIDRSP